MLVKVRNEETKEKFILSAFIGWQMGAGPGKRFGEYLESLGLLGEQVPTELTPRTNELDAKAAIAKAEEILRMAREKK